MTNYSFFLAYYSIPTFPSRLPIIHLNSAYYSEIFTVFAEEVDGVDESVVTLSVSANVEWSETCSVALPLLATVVPIEASLSESDSMINDHAFQGERSRTHAHKFTIRSHLPIIPVYYLSAYYSKNYASIICQPLIMANIVSSEFPCHSTVV